MPKKMHQFFVVIVVAVLFAPCPASAQMDDLTRMKVFQEQVMVFYNQGRYAEAVPFAQQALAISEKINGPEHPATATGLNNLGSLYESMGDYAKAEPLLKRSLAISEKVLGPEHPDAAISLLSLGLCTNPWETTPGPSRSMKDRWPSRKRSSGRNTPLPPLL